MNTIKRTLAQIISSVFPKSEKVISQALSVEDYNVFTTELKVEGERADALENQLTEANEKIAGLTKSLEDEKQGSATLQAALTAAESQLEKYKAHFEAASHSGEVTPDEDMNSREHATPAEYNAHALKVFKQHNN